MTQEYDHSAPLHNTSISQQPLKSTSWDSALKMHGCLCCIVQQWAKIILALYGSQGFITLFMRPVVSTLKKANSFHTVTPCFFKIHSLLTFHLCSGLTTGSPIFTFNPWKIGQNTYNFYSPRYILFFPPDILFQISFLDFINTKICVHSNCSFLMQLDNIKQTKFW
jgi:hypothetical protein